MPLTQLRTLVLPAPFGPISANSSPPATLRETSSSTRSPPKRSERCSIASSAIPPPASTVLLDGTVASALAAGMAEIEFLDVRMITQARGVTVQHDAAVFHDVTIVGNLQRHRRALLDNEDADVE